MDFGCPSVCTLFLISSLTLPLFSLPQTTSDIHGVVSDQKRLPISDAEITVREDSNRTETRVATDTVGSYRTAGFRPGVYTITISHPGFASKITANLLVTLNQSLLLDITLLVGSRQERVTVIADPPLLDTATSSTGSTILPSQVESMPLNGRNYLESLQLVPGVALNRNFKEGDDNSAPILGERANSAYVLIDGMPNRDEVDGGPAGQSNQDSILEFQVLTAGYKGVVGRGSGGIVNVATKSGTKDWHSSASLYLRNYLFDAPDVSNINVPFLLRWDCAGSA